MAIIRADYTQSSHKLRFFKEGKRYLCRWVLYNNIIRVWTPVIDVLFQACYDAGIRVQSPLFRTFKSKRSIYEF